MPFLPQFAHEVFLSYGRAGNDDPQIGDWGWICGFKKLLERNLSDSLPEPARGFLDLEKVGPGEVQTAVSGGLHGSAVFLGVLTPYSCRNGSWLREEHRQFSDFSLDPVSAEKRTDRSQVFTIRIRDVDHRQWPARGDGV